MLTMNHAFNCNTLLSGKAVFSMLFLFKFYHLKPMFFGFIYNQDPDKLILWKCTILGRIETTRDCANALHT